MSFAGVLPILGSFSKPLRCAPVRVAVDSRTSCQNAIFFALPGAVTDGHLFLQEAAKNGVVGAVICRNFSGNLPREFPVLKVDDPLAALQRLAREQVKRVGATSIALSGSVGKTTTKEFVRAILSVAGRVVATEGNQNSQIGLPMSILNGCQGDERWVVAEMGMTKPGHIKSLIDIIPPDIAAVVSVALVHAENFSSLDEIAQAKAELFHHEKTDWCLYNADSPGAAILRAAGRGRKRTFSSKDPSAYWFLEVTDSSLVLWENGCKQTLCKPSFPAQHVYDNLLAAIAVCRTAGISWEQISAALPRLFLPQGRLEMIEHKGVLFINDSYNANDISMIAALDVLSKQSPKRRVAVLGQMKELGSFSRECHMRVGERALAAVDELFCLGQECLPIVELWRAAGRPCFLAASLDELIHKVNKELCEGDAVLLKGSRSNHLWELIEAFKRSKL